MQGVFCFSFNGPLWGPGCKILKIFMWWTLKVDDEWSSNLGCGDSVMFTFSIGVRSNLEVPVHCFHISKLSSHLPTSPQIMMFHQPPRTNWNKCIVRMTWTSCFHRTSMLNDSYKLGNMFQTNHGQLISATWVNTPTVTIPWFEREIWPVCLCIFMLGSWECNGILTNHRRKTWKNKCRILHYNLTLYIISHLQTDN